MQILLNRNVIQNSDFFLLYVILLKPIIFIHLFYVHECQIDFVEIECAIALNLKFKQS